jgi:hypothetical protein
MGTSKHSSLRACTLAVCILLSSPTIQAADLYVNAEFGISLGIGTNDVSNSIDPGTPKSAESEDAAPVIGTGFGLAVPLYELFPWSMSIPRVEIPIWPGKALTMYGGGGVGVAFTELKTVARDDRAKEEGINFAYQFGAGLGYAMSDALHLSLGWRYVNFGVTEADLIDTVGTRIGKVESDVGAHEFTMSFRYAFWRVPLFEDRD